MALTAGSSQQFVPIKTVRDNIVVLKDGGLRAVLLATSVNLSLKSAEEQRAVLFQFQTFLNSLDFSTQIVIQSRRLDIRPYLLVLEGRMKEQVEPLMKIQMQEYIGFIRGFTENNSIMTKSFYIVVPYTAPSLDTKKGFMKSFMPGNSKSKPGVPKDDIIDFEEKRSQLEQRIAVIEGGLQGSGIKTEQLKTDALIELFYKVFNPGEIGKSIQIQDAGRGDGSLKQQ